jgi:hypothetical protein
MYDCYSTADKTQAFVKENVFLDKRLDLMMQKSVYKYTL